MNSGVVLFRELTADNEFDNVVREGEALGFMDAVGDAVGTATLMIASEGISEELVTAKLKGSLNASRDSLPRMAPFLQ